MCCSRSHYPQEVGLHPYYDGRSKKDSHHHIILPWDLQVGICIVGRYFDSWACVQYSHFTKDGRQRVQRLTIKKTPVPSNQVADLIAIAVAEGGELHYDWLFKLMQERFPSWNPFIESDDPSNSWKIIPPDPLEYHEWLVWQAKKERSYR